MRDRPTPWPQVPPHLLVPSSHDRCDHCGATILHAYQSRAGELQPIVCDNPTGAPRAAERARFGLAPGQHEGRTVLVHVHRDSDEQSILYWLHTDEKCRDNQRLSEESRQRSAQAQLDLD